MTPRGASRLRPTRKPSRKTTSGGEHPGRPDGRQRRRPSAEADPEPAGEQVPEHGVDGRDAPEDLAPVEECERDGEAEKHQQVEVAHGQRPAQVGEPDEEDEAEGEPHVRLQERLATERSLSATRHLPGDLRARPRLGDLARRVLYDRLGDLARDPPPHLDGPRARVVVEVRTRRRVRRVPLEPARDLRVGERELRRLVLAQSRRVARDRLSRALRYARKTAASAASAISFEVPTTRAYCRRNSPA